MTLMVLGLATATLVSATGAALSAPDVPCTCRYKGLDMQIGDLVCAELPNGDVMMVCDRVLNNTAWKTVQQGCPVTQIETPTMSRIKG
ncbi:MAG: hypothetical protein WA921_00360 [Ahrensia sp.]